MSIFTTKIFKFYAGFKRSGAFHPASLLRSSVSNVSKIGRLISLPSGRCNANCKLWTFFSPLRLSVTHFHAWASRNQNKNSFFFSSQSGGFKNPLDILFYYYFNHPLLPMNTQYMQETLIITVVVVTLPNHRSSQLNVTLSDVTQYLCNVIYVVPVPILLENARRN